jgi:hypothetical protein
MPKKTKAEQQEIMDTGMEQQAKGETPDGTQDAAGQNYTERYNDDASGELLSEMESDGDIPDVNDGIIDGEPDPALDPALVIPSPELTAAASGNPERFSEEPEPQYAEPEVPADMKDTAEIEAPAPVTKPKATRPAQQRRESTATRAQSGQAQARRSAAAPLKRVVAIDEELQMQTDEEKEAYLWMEFRNSQRSKRILTGILDGIERSPNGNVIAVVYYNSPRVVIPASEMYIRISEEPGQDPKLLNHRYSQILTRGHFSSGTLRTQPVWVTLYQAFMKKPAAIIL